MLAGRGAGAPGRRRQAPVSDTESVSTFDALGRVLAAPCAPRSTMPPADNTSMDGYALRAADVAAYWRRCCQWQRIPAGT